MAKRALIILGASLSILIALPSYALHKMNILVYPFENTGPKEFSWISAGMTETVIADLTRLRSISVITDESRRKALKEMTLGQAGALEDETVIEVGKVTGANLVCSGSYMVIGNRIRAIAKLINIETGAVKTSAKIDGTVDGIFELQDAVVFTLMAEAEKVEVTDMAKIRFAETSRKEIAEKAKPKQEAYEWYAKAKEIQNTDPKQAMVYLEYALEAEPEYLEALSSIGILLGLNLGRFDEALEYLSKGDMLYRSSNKVNTDGYAKLLTRTGVVYAVNGDFDGALEYYFKSQQIQDGLGLQNTERYAGLMSVIGVAYLGKDDPNKALEYYDRSQRIRDELGLQVSFGYAGLMWEIGVLYRQEGDYNQALEYFYQNQNIKDRLGLQHTDSYARTMYEIAYAYSRKGDSDRALEHYFKSQQIKDGLGLQNSSGYSGLMWGIAGVYFDKGDLNKARSYYMKSQRIKDSLDLQHTEDYASLISMLGFICREMHNLDCALEYYERSREIYGALGLKNTPKYAKATSRVAAVYWLKGEYSRAIREDIKGTLVGLISVALAMAIACAFAVLIYRAVPYRKWTEKKPPLAIMPKYRADFQGAVEHTETALSEIGFRQSKRDAIIYRRGRALSVFSSKGRRLRVEIDNEKSEFKVSAPFSTMLFDTGSLWQVVAEILDRSRRPGQATKPCQ